MRSSQNHTLVPRILCAFEQNPNVSVENKSGLSFFFSHSRFHSLINGGLLRFIKKRNWYCFSTIVFVALGLPGFGVSGLRHNCAGDQNWPGRAFVSISHPRQQSVNINFERYCSLRRLSTDSVHFSPVLFPLFS